LLIVPNAESALNEEAGRLILEDYEAFTERAKLLTSIHAKPVISSTERKSGPDSSRNSSENSTENTVASNITGPESSSPRKRPQTDTKKVDAKKKTLKRL
jgi:ubiquitin-conjugating enzyme E2 S